MSNFPYHSDLRQRTPLQLAMRADAFDAVDSILGAMGEEQSSSDDILRGFPCGGLDIEWSCLYVGMRRVWSSWPWV